MIRTNLSTRPFYNERVVHVALALLAVAGLGVSVLNARWVASASRQNTELTARAEQAERRAADLRREAAGTQRQINPAELESVTKAAAEANELIGRRTFSWTDLFNRFEATLPPDVRISAVRPRIDRAGSVVIVVGVVGRSVEDIDRFIENLEATGAFADVLSREETVGAGGLIETTLEGLYIPGAPAAPDEPEPAAP